MPGYDYATGALEEAGVPLIVKATGDAFAVEDTTVSAAHRDRVYDYLEKGGTINTANLCRFLTAEYEGHDVEYDGPTELPTEGVYHPDHPGIEYEDLLETHDPEADGRGLVLRVPLDPREHPVRGRAGQSARGARCQRPTDFL